MVKKTIFILMALSVSTMHSQLLMDDNLSSMSISQLSGQGNWTNNSSTYGGGACAGFGCTNTQVLAFTQSYPNYRSATNSAKLLPNQDAVGRNFITMALPADGNNFYFSFLMNTSTLPSTTPSDFIRVLSSGSFNTAFRLALQNATGGFKVGGSKSSGSNIFSNTVLPLNTTHLVVVKYTLNSASTSDDVISIYLNPTSTGEPSTADITISSGSDYAATLNLDRFLLRTNTANIPTANLTAFKASKTYSELFSLTLATSEKENINDEVKILENPTDHFLRISLPRSYKENNTYISIFDSSGKKLSSQSYHKDIDISDLPKGVYLVEVSNGKNKNSYKFIKK